MENNDTFTLKDKFQVFEAGTIYPELFRPPFDENLKHSPFTSWIVQRHSCHMACIVFHVDESTPFLCSECSFFGQCNNPLTTECVHIMRVREDFPLRVTKHPVNMTEEKMSLILDHMNMIWTKVLLKSDRRLMGIYSWCLHEQGIDDFQFDVPFPELLSTHERQMVQAETSIMPLIMESLLSREVYFFNFSALFKSRNRKLAWIKQAVRHFNSADDVLSEIIKDCQELGKDPEVQKVEHDAAMEYLKANVGIDLLGDSDE